MLKRQFLLPAVFFAFVASTPAHPPLLVALGDSITYGWALPHPSSQNYATLYALRTGARLVNLAVPGYTCAQVRERLSRMPDGASSVILNCGTNDIGGFGATNGALPNGHHRIAPATQAELFSAEKDYRDILSTIRKSEPRARIIALTIRHWQRMTGPEDNRFAKDVTTWNAMIRAAGVQVVDIAADSRMYQAPYIQPDLIHPNVAGNKAIANDVLAANDPPAPALANAAAIDRFVENEMAVTHVPGAAVGVYSRGRILLAKGYGLANVELSVPVKPQTVFESGSVGKQFVSAAIMMLVEQGRISLDDSVTKYFPEAPPSWKPIEIKNLLSHTSGLSEYITPDRTGPAGAFYLRLDFTEAELANKIEAMPIENAPGEKWNYRNTNYVLLGILIHRVTGMFYGDYLAKRIFEPLGMTSTRVMSDAAIIPNRAAGYEWENGKLRNQEWVSPTFNSTADGALYFNVLDLAKWDGALYGTRLLKQSSLNQMWTVYKLNDGKPNPAGYGFAWRIHRRGGHLVVEHSGAWEGFTCNISRYPDDGLTVVVLTNMDSDHARPDYMAPVIAGMVDPSLMPEKLAKIADDQPQLAASLASLLNAVSAGDTDIRNQVSLDFAEAFTPAEAANTRHLLAPLWPGGRLTLVARMPSADNGSLIFSQYRITKGTHSMLVTYALDAKGKVDTLYFEPDEEYRTVDLYGG